VHLDGDVKEPLLLQTVQGDVVHRQPLASRLLGSNDYRFAVAAPARQPDFGATYPSAVLEGRGGGLVFPGACRMPTRSQTYVTRIKH